MARLITVAAAARPHCPERDATSGVTVIGLGESHEAAACVSDIGQKRFHGLWS
jgi:hypothetical protein